MPEIILYYDQTKPNHFIRGSDFRLLYSNICHSATLGTGLWACFGTYNVPYRASTDIFFQSETSLIVINESNTSAPKSAKLNSHRLWTLFLEICIVEFLSLSIFISFIFYTSMSSNQNQLHIQEAERVIITNLMKRLAWLAWLKSQ